MSKIKIEIENRVGWITLDRPEKLNAILSDMITDLTNAVEKLKCDDEVSVIVLGASGKSFSVGYDIAEEMSHGDKGVEEVHATLTRKVTMVEAIWTSKKPTIAMVNGWCLAGACEMAMACDMIIASDTAKFGEPEIRFGSGPVALVMPFVLGQKKTMELLLTGDVIDAAEADRQGLVNRVVKPEDLHATVKKLADSLAVTPLRTLQLTKTALVRAYEIMGLRNVLGSNNDVAAILNSIRSPEKTEFSDLVRSKGLREALRWRDERYGSL